MLRARRRPRRRGAGRRGKRMTHAESGRDPLRRALTRPPIPATKMSRRPSRLDTKYTFCRRTTRRGCGWTPRPTTVTNGPPVTGHHDAARRDVAERRTGRAPLRSPETHATQSLRAQSQVGSPPARARECSAPPSSAATTGFATRRGPGRRRATRRRRGRPRRESPRRAAERRRDVSTAGVRYRIWLPSGDQRGGYSNASAVSDSVMARPPATGRT